MVSSRSLVGLAAVAILPSGLQAASPVQSTDSAGVALITSAGPALPSERAWTLDPEPVLQLGTVDGAPAVRFTRISDALRTPDGHLVVVEGAEQEIRVFDPSGAHRATFGGPGDGPEEFGGRPVVARAEDGSLVIWDSGHYRLSSYDLDGALLSQVTLVSALEGLPLARFPRGRIWQLRSDGTLLYGGPELGRLGPGPRDFTRRIVLVQDEGERAHDFGGVVSGRSVQAAAQAGITDPFAPSVAHALGPDPWPVVLADEEAWGVRFFDGAGELRRILRAPIPRNPLTDEVLERHRAELSGDAARMGVSAAALERAFDRLPLPDSLPAIASLMFDTEGNLWVGRREGSVSDVSVHDVFGVDGGWVTTVRLPDGVGRILEVGADRVVTEWVDEVDVPYVRVYRLRKGGGP